MLATNISTFRSIQAQKTIVKPQSQVCFTSRQSQDTFTSSKKQATQNNISFSGLIPQCVLKLFGKDEESKRKAALNDLVDMIIAGEDFDLKQDYIDELLSEDDYNYAKGLILDKSVESIAQTDSKELQNKQIALLLHYDLIPELVRKQLHFKGVMKCYREKPMLHSFPSQGVIDRNKMFTNALSKILDDSNSGKVYLKQQYLTAIKDHLLSKSEHWAGLRSEAVDILRDNAKSIEDIEPFFDAIDLNEIKGTKIIGREIPTFHKITYPLDVKVKIKALKAIPVVLDKIEATSGQVDSVKQRIETVKQTTESDELKLACYEALEQMA